MAEKIKIAIWGLGRAGYNMHRTELEKFPELFEIAGCYDVIPERMVRLQENHPECRMYDSPGAMLADPALELIAVAVRSRDHADFAIRVLESGKACVAEKPLALSAEELRRLKAASDRHPGKLFCRQNRRWESCFHQVCEILEEGILGEIYEIKLCRHNYNRRADWQTLKSEGGGMLNNWGPHLIDHALQFINGPLESVWSDLKHIAAMGDAEDHVKAVLRGVSGMVVDLEISGAVALKSPVYAVYGSRGSLISDDEKIVRLKYLDQEKTEVPDPVSNETPPQDSPFSANRPMVWIEESRPVAPRSGAALTDMYRAVYETMREGRPFPVTVEQAVRVVEVAEIIRCGGQHSF